MRAQTSLSEFGKKNESTSSRICLSQLFFTSLQVIMTLVLHCVEDKERDMHNIDCA